MKNIVIVYNVRLINDNYTSIFKIIGVPEEDVKILKKAHMKMLCIDDEPEIQILDCWLSDPRDWSEDLGKIYGIAKVDFGKYHKFEIEDNDTDHIDCSDCDMVIVSGIFESA